MSRLIGRIYAIASQSLHLVIDEEISLVGILRGVMPCADGCEYFEPSGVSTLEAPEIDPGPENNSS